MAISLVKIPAKLSVSNLSVVLTDNFNIIEEALTDITNIVNIGTGKIDNSAFGTDNNLKTGNIEAIGSSGITITLGNLTLDVGRIIMSGTGGRVEIGSDVKFERITKNLSAGTIETIDLSGTSGAATGVGNVGPIALPRITNATIVDITTPVEGMIVWDETLKKLKLYDGTTWVDLN